MNGYRPAHKVILLLLIFYMKQKMNENQISLIYVRDGQVLPVESDDGAKFEI